MEQSLLSCIESRVESNRSFYGRFQLGPFEYGQGLTVANALRRTLLSELTGLAIVAVEIDGANHEFSTLRGVRESVLDILLNLKQIVFKSHVPLQNPEIGYLYVTGPGIVKASGMKLPLSIQSIDPEQYIAELSYDGILNIKFVISEGKNYLFKSPTEFSLTNFKKNSKTGLPEVNSFFQKNNFSANNDFYKRDEGNKDRPKEYFSRIKQKKNSKILPLDAVFMPVNRVNFLVENHDELTNLKERVIFEIWTNGSIHPRQAIHEGAKSLIDLFSPFKETRLLNSFLRKTRKISYKIPPSSSFPLLESNLFSIEEKTSGKKDYPALLQEVKNRKTEFYTSTGSGDITIKLSPPPQTNARSLLSHISVSPIKVPSFLLTKKLKREINFGSTFSKKSQKEFVNLGGISGERSIMETQKEETSTLFLKKPLTREIDSAKQMFTPLVKGGVRAANPPQGGVSRQSIYSSNPTRFTIETEEKTELLKKKFVNNFFRFAIAPRRKREIYYEHFGQKTDFSLTNRINREEGFSFSYNQKRKENETKRGRLYKQTGTKLQSFLEKDKRKIHNNIEKKIVSLDIANLDLSLRPFTSLKRAKINTVRDLIQYSAEELLLLKNFGKRSLEEVEKNLKNLGLSLWNP
uniref:DNA-directed RNA polymerase subunit alpha n=1 Tax=Pleurastrosarcina brevispinosa TaxID=163096 RepID=A0A097KN47_9CHLO|nr:alpha subunit of RNA polymerase [Chlorosarcina brevispinosa]